MAEGIASGLAATVLDYIFNAGTPSAISEVWVKLHVGAPGSAGTSNAATETTRKQLSCSAASGGVITSDAALTWTSISGSEDPTHFSLWTASTGGTFLGSGTITSNAYVAGNTFTIPTGDFDLTIPTAS